MTQTLQTNFNLNRYSYIMPPAAKQEQKTGDTKSSVPDKKSQQNMLLYSLGGLAVLGTTAAIIKSHLSGNKANKNDKGSVNIVEIIKLKNKIRNNFVEKREPIRQKLFEELENMSPEYKFKTIGQINAMLMEMQSNRTSLQTRLIQHKTEQTKIIKQKLANLAKDKEWLELRKLRKSYLKILKGKEPAEQQQIADKKIVLINNLLINKAYPEEIERFKTLYQMDPSTALEFVKKDYKTIQDYNEAFKDAQTLDIPYGIPAKERNFSHSHPLKPRDVFPDEALSCEECDQKLYYINTKTERLSNIMSEYKEKIKQIAEQSRNSVDVKSLKAEIKHLKK